MEDFVNLETICNDNENQVIVLCDGHGGSLAAIVTTKELPRIFRENLKKLHEENFDDNTIIEEAINKSFEQMDQFLSTLNVKDQTVKKVENENNENEDEDLLDDDNVNEELENGGCTCNFIYICKRNNKRIIYSANVGDSRTVLIKNHTSVRLSYDHKATDKNEQARIRKEKGKIIKDRFYGLLAITRSLADFSMKKNFNGLSIIPHIDKVEITVQDIYLIVASDGLWDVIKDEKARELLLNFNTSDLKCTNLANYLIKTSIDYGTKDNVSCIVITLN
jgi:protein phosphatase PTC1